MNSTLNTTRQVPHDPRIQISKAQLLSMKCFLNWGIVFDKPFNFDGTEASTRQLFKLLLIRIKYFLHIKWQSAYSTQIILLVLRSSQYRIFYICQPRIIPYEWIEYFAAMLVPQQCRLPLICNSNCDDLIGVDFEYF